MAMDPPKVQIKAGPGNTTFAVFLLIFAKVIVFHFFLRSSRTVRRKKFDRSFGFSFQKPNTLVLFSLGSWGGPCRSHSGTTVLPVPRIG